MVHTNMNNIFYLFQIAELVVQTDFRIKLGSIFDELLLALSVPSPDAFDLTCNTVRAI